VEPVRKLDRSVKGRAVLITGAASGMGRATAHLFAQEGATVAVTDVNQPGIEAVVAEIQGQGGKAEGWHLDVFDTAEIKRVVAEVAERFGRLDILINNAGFGAFRPIDDDRFQAI
jgi:3-oxoacyl-[acyl-carrier protein] reductase